jgi:hypothetical protein
MKQVSHDSHAFWCIKKSLVWFDCDFQDESPRRIVFRSLTA